MDMVNPMPASSPNPKICFQFASDGSDAIPDFTAIQEKRVTPIGLPTTRPKIIPKPSGLVRPAIIWLSKRIFVFASANTGIIKKFTGLTMMCSNFSSGEVLFIVLFGIVKASNTPAIVA